MTDVKKKIEVKSTAMAHMVDKNYEHINFFYDHETDTKAIIAIHSTKLGPALGGLRFYPYEDEASALKDVLRLSRAMSYKAAVAELNLGGGKSVIIGDPKKLKNEAVLRSFGRFVERLNGKYITSVDSGTVAQDLIAVKQETNHVVGAPASHGGTGDPSPMTAFGVFQGIKASIQHQTQSDNLNGKTVAVQGLGNVGYHLCSLLHQAGAKLIVSDINPDKNTMCAQELGAQVVDIDKILSASCDVLAPCALGGVINDQSIPKLNTKIIAGAANNQLSDHSIAQKLKDQGIVYAPDFVINAGGLISVDQERFGANDTAVKEKTQKIYDIILSILQGSEKENKSTAKIAIEMAKKRIYKA